MKKSGSAFTLIELLVVIVIIAILAGIALPVFSRVMEKGKGVKDLNNMKQIGTALLLMINDDQGWLPSDTVEWPQKIVSGEKLDDTGVFMSAFDGRAQTTGDSFLTSFGLNSDMITNRDTSKWKNSSSLIMLAPAPTPASTPGSLVFANTNISAALTRPVDGSPALGTMSNGQMIGVLFADFHVENVRWNEYTVDGTKYYWSVGIPVPPAP